MQIILANNHLESPGYLAPQFSMRDEESHFPSSEQLHSGVFVVLDRPWFKHSVALNSFKICNDGQLQALPALKLPRYRFDPVRSDPLNNVQTAALPDSQYSAPAFAEVWGHGKPTTTDRTPETAAKRDQKAEFSAWRNQFDNVERAFTKATTVVKNLNRNVLTRPSEMRQEMSVLSEQMIAAFLDNTDATLHLMSDEVGGEDGHCHSLNLTILFMMLAKGLGFTPEMACELGIAVGQKVVFSAQALAVISQPHEMMDGSGFPDGLKGGAIAVAGYLVALLKSYENLCNSFDIDGAMTPHQALSSLFAMRRKKFDAKILWLLIRSLGVYPPGSIVQLSNQTPAMVMSVNPKKPLRPRVMVHDFQIAKDETIILDLAREVDIAIGKAIRPSALAPKVAAYLNPRQHVTDYFDSGHQVAAERG